MSQSPDSSSPLEGVARYIQGWKALNRLLHEDRSFSGNERNCAWLNTGGENFADISGISGFDFPDDGRALCLADWDFDGDVDVWIANRTAPRLRFLQNNCRDHSRFVAFRLQGDGVKSNRDAIGAQLVLHLQGDTPVQLTKSLASSDGFLSQSSRWVHFGIGDQSRIEKLVVRWPGGDSETFANLAPGKFYIVPKNGNVTTWVPPNIDPFAQNSSPLILPRSPDIGQIVLTSPLPMPKLNYVDWDDQVQPIDYSRDGPVAINLWSSSCVSCMKEMASWNKQKTTFSHAGLNVLALSVDSLEEAEIASGDAKATLTRMKLALPAGRATRTLLDQLDVMQRAVLDRWQTLPLPCTFLVDKQGSLVAIYKGLVEPQQMIDDLNSVAASKQKHLARVTPLAGRWVNSPGRLSPLSVASLLLDNGRVAEAISYLEDRSVDLDMTTMSSAQRIQAADLQYTLGLLLAESKQPSRAMEVLLQASKFNPRDVRIHQQLGEMAVQQKDFDHAAEYFLRALTTNPDNVALHHKMAMIRGVQNRHADAVKHFQQVARAHPENAMILFQLSTALLGAGQAEQAIVGYRKALEGNPNMLPALNNLAWVLATHKDAKLRNGKEAVELASRLCELSQFKHPRSLATLAAANAESGDFAKAITHATRASELFEARGDTKNVATTEKQLQLYRNGRPFHAGSEATPEQ